MIPFEKLNEQKLENIPYNDANVLISITELKRLISRYGVTIEIKNLEYYHEAFTHKSYVCYDLALKEKFLKVKELVPMYRSSLQIREKSYERLEFLGDTVIKLIISNYLFQRYPLENEGFMTRMKTKIENRSSLAKLANAVGLGKYLIISLHVEHTIQRTSEKLLEDAFEAFFGALFLDSGFEKCTHFLISILEQELDFSDILWIDTNYKDQLLRYYHQNNWNYPKYECLSVSGNSYKKLFNMGVLDNNGKIIAEAADYSKRKAEQEASRMALVFFKQIENTKIKYYNLLDINTLQNICSKSQI